MFEVQNQPPPLEDYNLFQSDAVLSEALRRMTAMSPKISAIIAVEGGRPVGIVHLHDCPRVGLV